MKSGCRSCALAAASSSALGINRRKITHTSTSIWAMPVRSAAPIALRYSVSIRAWAHTKLIRQIVLTVTWTELKSSNAASLVMLPAANQRQAPSSRSLGAVPWPRTIRIRQDASVTTAEPAIAVARDQVIDRVADHPSDEVEDPCPLPARKLARNAQRGLGRISRLRVGGRGACVRSGRPFLEGGRRRTPGFPPAAARPGVGCLQPRLRRLKPGLSVGLRSRCSPALQAAPSAPLRWCVGL
jgi:hypothetical protein